MPQRHVLVSRQHMAANDAGQPAHVLAADRVALVRHRRRALLPFGERLLHLAELALLQGADFRRELVERRGDQRQCRHIFRMAVALQRLRRDRRRRNAELAADELLRRTDRCSRTCRPRRTFCRIARRSPHAEPLQVALHFLVPKRQLQTESRRLGMHAVRTAHHRRIFVANRLLAQNLDEVLDIFLAGFRSPAAANSPVAVSTTSVDVRP